MKNVEIYSSMFESNGSEDISSDLLFSEDIDEQTIEDILKLTASSDGVRIDSFLAENTDFTRTFAANLCEKGCVTVNGKTAKKNTKLSDGDEIIVNLPESESIDAVPENIHIDIALSLIHI